MGIIFNTINKVQKVKQPLFQINRARYRGVRSSELENSEINLIKLDLTRINLELDSIDLKILEDLTVIIGDKDSITYNTNLNDGLSNELTGIDIKFDDKALQEDIEIESIDKMSGKIARLLNKVSRLEKGWLNEWSFKYQKKRHYI